MCLIRCIPQRLTYRRGHSLFILVTGSFRNLYRENKQNKVPRFSFVPTGRLEPTSHKTNYYGTKIYYTFVEMLSTYEIAYHILHRNKAIDKQSR